MKKTKYNYYSLKAINAKNCLYNVIIGERSNGKTYAVLKQGIENYADKGEQMGIIRRWADDFKGHKGQALFAGLVANGVVIDATKGEWTDIHFTMSRWYFCRYDEDGKRIDDDTPFAWAFALSTWEHDKGASYPKITTILFDEFITRNGYFDDEFILFTNTISTIVRLDNKAKIYMCGNTISKYNPYFKEMGLTHAKDMKQGTIDVYTYGNSELRVAVEFCASGATSKDSDVYFAFDNPKLSMITGKGNVWELAIYPHAPIKWKPKDIIFTFFIEFADNLLQCEVINNGVLMFVYIHRKTTPLKNPNKDLIYTTSYDPRPNWRRGMYTTATKTETKILDLLSLHKFYFQDNETGDIFSNWLLWSKQNK